MNRLVSSSLHDAVDSSQTEVGAVTRIEPASDCLQRASLIHAGDPYPENIDSLPGRFLFSPDPIQPYGSLFHGHGYKQG